MGQPSAFDPTPPELLRELLEFREAHADILRALADHCASEVAALERAPASEPPALAGPGGVVDNRVPALVPLRELLASAWDDSHHERAWHRWRREAESGRAPRDVYGSVVGLRGRLTATLAPMLGQQIAPVAAERALLKAFDLELAVAFEAFCHVLREAPGGSPAPSGGALPDEATVASILDSLAVLVCGLDPDGRIELFNEPCQRLTAMSREAALGARWLDIFVPEARRDVVVGLWQDVSAGRSVPPYESLCRKARRIRWQFAPLRRHGSKTGICAMGLDVTEERAASASARQAERMAGLGSLTAGLAHQIRNPLNGALLQLTLAARRLARVPEKDVAPVGQSIENATGDMRRVATLLDDFLAFARPEALVRKQLDLRALAERAVEAVRPHADAAGVQVVIDPGSPILAEVDGDRVAAALDHLLRNAIEAAAARGQDGRARLALAVHGQSATIEVADNGPGLPSPQTPIFDPFFTTKASGTGLGLPIVHRTASDHGGGIEVERVADATVFRLSLPLLGM